MRDMHDIENFLSTLESSAYNAGYELDLNDPYKIKIEPTKDKDLMPYIYAEYQEDDVFFWYRVEMTFPKSMSEEETNYMRFSSYMRDWMDAAKLADYLMEHKWEIDTEWED